MITNIQIASLTGEIEQDQITHVNETTKPDQKEIYHFDASAASVIKPLASNIKVDKTKIVSKMKMEGFVPTTKVKKDQRYFMENQMFQKSTPRDQNNNFTSKKSEANIKRIVTETRPQNK